MVMILHGQIEKILNNIALFVYKENNEYKEIQIPEEWLKKINSDYEGSQVDIKIVKSKRKPIWLKKTKL